MMSGPKSKPKSEEKEEVDEAIPEVQTTEPIVNNTTDEERQKRLEAIEARLKKR